MKNKILFIGVTICLVILLSIGVSYSMWKTNLVGSTTSLSTLSCFSLSLEEKNAIDSSTNTSLQKSMSDDNGKKTTPYTFTITNSKCSVSASYTVYLEVLDGSSDNALSLEYLKAMVNSEEIKTLNNYEEAPSDYEFINSNATSAYILATGILGSGYDVEYNLRLWVSDGGDAILDSSLINGKTFSGKIVIKSTPTEYDPVSAGYNKLSEALLVNEYQTDSLDYAKEKIASKTEPDFSKTAPIITWEEEHEENITSSSVTVPHESLVGNASLGGGNLTDGSSKLLLGTSYSFDKSSGWYSLENVAYYSVEELSSLDFVNNNYYTTAWNELKISSTGEMSVAWHNERTDIYRVSGVTSSTSGESGTNGYRRIYTISGNRYTEGAIESDKSDKGLYAAEDDYGTSYYYRGSVTNNNVYFANLYWKIIRINGDGSIRLIYNGTSLNATGNNALYGASSFNSNYNNPAYVGLKYGSTLNSSYKETNANENDSTILTKLYEFYTTYLNSYSNYLADSGFCGDRSVYIGDGFSTTSNTYYGTYNRLVSNKIPIFTCPNKDNDLYTTSSSSVGNKSLSYPVGLITADEVAMAGLVSGYQNTMFYLSGSNFYTMSPTFYANDDSHARNFSISSNGKLSYGYIESSSGVRPVINLKADVKITGGTGLNTDPFTISIE